MDIYSENPYGDDPYNFTPSDDECGNYSQEGDCYNKEHIIPKSVFNEESPMQGDAHHLLPTDGRVMDFVEISRLEELMIIIYHHNQGSQIQLKMVQN